MKKHGLFFILVLLISFSLGCPKNPTQIDYDAKRQRAAEANKELEKE